MLRDERSRLREMADEIDMISESVHVRVSKLSDIAPELIHEVFQLKEISIMLHHIAGGVSEA